MAKAKVKTNIQSVQDQLDKEQLEAEEQASQKALDARKEREEALSAAPPEMGSEEAPSPTQRRYAGEQKVDSDLFKLEVAIMKKNSALNPKKEKPVWVLHEHTHVFRTFDSSGRPQSVSSPIGGHYHLVTVRTNPKGGIPHIEISPPMKKVGNPATGETYDASIPGDTHTHQVSYIRSDKVTIRKMNQEAQAALTTLAVRQTPRLPSGVEEAGER